MKNNEIRMSIDVPSDLHKIIKCASTLNNQSIKEFVIESIKKNVVTLSKVPNKKTLETLQKSDKGEELSIYEDLNDFIKEMDS